MTQERYMREAYARAKVERDNGLNRYIIALRDDFKLQFKQIAYLLGSSYERVYSRYNRSREIHYALRDERAVLVQKPLRRVKANKNAYLEYTAAYEEIMRGESKGDQQ